MTFYSSSPNTPLLVAGLKAKRTLRSFSEEGLTATKNSARYLGACAEELHLQSIT